MIKANEISNIDIRPAVWAVENNIANIVVDLANGDYYGYHAYGDCWYEGESLCDVADVPVDVVASVMAIVDVDVEMRRAVEMMSLRRADALLWQARQDGGDDNVLWAAHAYLSERRAEVGR